MVVTLPNNQSIVRQEWFGALSRGIGYNLEIINEDLLRTCADYINERVRKAEMEMEEICRLANNACNPAAPRSPSKCQHARRCELPSRACSASPMRAGHSKRHCQSCSPPAATNSLRRQTDRCPRKNQAEFFHSGADPHGGVCAACLDRHDHAFSKCDGHKLWDGTPRISVAVVLAEAGSKTEASHMS